MNLRRSRGSLIREGSMSPGTPQALPISSSRNLEPKLQQQFKTTRHSLTDEEMGTPTRTAWG